MNPAKIVLIFLFAFSIQSMEAQQLRDSLSGHIFEIWKKGDTIPVFGAIVCWEGSQICTQSDTTGYFLLPPNPLTTVITIQYPGYRNSEVNAGNDAHTDVILAAELMEDVEIIRRKKSTEIGYIDPIKVEKFGEKEFQKAACCNLSESFETSPSVDVSFTDAVTGTRQIQLLGLAGAYTQITRENIPDVRGLSAVTGLTYIPGTWVESLQLNKGAGSVVNGYEGIAGQINYELRKPAESDKFFFNFYGSEGGRMEANLHLAHRLSESLSTGFLFHGWYNQTKNDRNSDGFLDNLLGHNFIGLHRWNYEGHNGFCSQFLVKGTLIDRVGGELDFDKETESGTTSAWGLQSSTRRLDVSLKAGTVNPEQTWKSTGSQFAATFENYSNWFGLRKYEAMQRSFYGNLIHQGKFATTDHSFKTGLSFLYDRFDENFNDSLWIREEIVPGAFFEYAYKFFEKFAVVAGIRADCHNLYGLFLTPRLHLRYELPKGFVFRASAGRGQRTASVFAENIGPMASSRQFVVRMSDPSLPYGLRPEIAWNYGCNLTKSFEAWEREGTITFDLYHTDFVDQVVVDFDSDPQQIRIYNLSGRSFSNSFQSQFDFEILPGLEMRTAYRWYDVRTDYEWGLGKKPLLSAHRAFLNLAYETSTKWKFDGTVSWNGSKRIPYTGTNPEEFQIPRTSPAFFMVNGQITKSWSEVLEIYVGGENLLNFKQTAPILSASQPFSPYFDASLVWGPVFGRMLYGGLRLSLGGQHEDEL